MAPATAGWGRTLMSGLPRDIASARRALGGHPGFATAAVMTVALAVGGASTAFAVVYGVLFRPPPYPEPERLVRPWEASA